MVQLSQESVLMFAEVLMSFIDEEDPKLVARGEARAGTLIALGVAFALADPAIAQMVFAPLVGDEAWEDMRVSTQGIARAIREHSTEESH